MIELYKAELQELLDLIDELAIEYGPVWPQEMRTRYSWATNFLEKGIKTINDRTTDVL